MRSIAKLILISIFLPACTDSFGKLRTDIDNTQRDVSDLRSFQAEQTTQIETLRNDVRSLTGRLDLIEHSQSNNKIGTDLSSLQNDLSTLKRRVPPPSIVPVGALEVDEVLAGSLPENISGIFLDSLQKIREGNFEYAIPILKNALDQSCGKEWCANILFWLGISYEGLGDNRNALASYNEIVTRFSKNERAPLALFRQSGVFIRLGDKATAKLSLKKLVEDYPKSLEAGQAKEKLKAL